MQQATKEHINTPDDKGPAASWFIGNCPSETMENCADVVEFLGDALDGIGAAGMAWEQRTSNAVAIITRTLRDTMRWEAQRTAFKRIDPKTRRGNSMKRTYEARVITSEELLARGFSKAELLANRINGLLGFSVYEKAKRENLNAHLEALYRELNFTPRLTLSETKKGDEQ